MVKQKNYKFDISLSVLNHLGRNLYRSFVTVIGEAISNAWDADAENVWIYINKEKNSFIIKDDGKGMNEEDFQDKFLKIGYSKRKLGSKSEKKGRPFIGRKGIGKLALLSCADTITIMTKLKGGEYEGGVIDNKGLDEAIKDDLSSNQYILGRIEYDKLEYLTKNHKHGTIIYFEGMKDGIKKSVEHLRKLIALYFRFSLLDESFNIWLDDKLITHEDLASLANSTQFVWLINEINDPYLASLKKAKKKYKKTLKSNLLIKGFIASVEKPLNLKIISTEEKAGIDLLVNGRLREKDILKHIPTARIVESYLYGQIHFDALDKDDDKDRFTSSRESIIADDEEFQELLNNIKNILLPEIIEDWDVWRLELGRDGDDDNLRITSKERKSRALFNVVSQDYSIPDDEADSKDKAGQWVKELAKDATFNFSSYADCFVSENLLRKYIEDKNISLHSDAPSEISKLKSKETANKSAGNLNIDIRQNNNDLSYLDMALLAKTVDPQRGTTNTLDLDAKQYKPIRDALAHTSLLTEQAKVKLTSVYDNIKARIKILLSNL